MSKCWRVLLLFVFWISGGSAAHAFSASPGTVAIGPVALTATKTGTTDLANATASAVTFDLSTCSTEFQITSTNVTLGPTATTVTASFTPSTAGNKSCSVNVKNGGSTVGTFMISGTGVGTPQITFVAGGPLPFNHVDVGSTSATQPIIAKNTGTDTLTISSAAILTTPANYQVSRTGNLTLAPNEQVTWSIACKPQTQNAVDDKFRIASNSATNGTVDIALTCIGDKGSLTVDLSTLAFGARALNSTKTLPVVLSNTGNVSVTGIAAALGNNNLGYSFAAATVPSSLTAAGTPSSSATVMVTFAPTAVGHGGNNVLTFTGAWKTSHAASATTTLTAQTVAISVSTTTIALGPFRFDQLQQVAFQIVNSGSADIPISSVTFVPDSGTAAAEVPFTVKLGSAPANLSNPLPAGAHYDVAATVRPADRVGAIGGKFIVHSSLAGLNDLMVTLTGMATAAVVRTTDVDFGPVDLQAASPTMTATIMNTNTGTATLDVSAISVIGSVGTASAFIFTNPLPTGVTHLMPNTGLPIEVTYKPTIQRGPSDLDKVVLIATLTGELDGPKAALITIQGRGMDRDLVVPGPSSFLTAFRNPGETAPVHPVTIRNSGEAVLKVRAAMVSGGPIWKLAPGDPTSVDIAGGQSHDFRIMFEPTRLGPAPPGQLAFTTDDAAHAMAMIPLNGMATNRNVTFGPNVGISPRIIYFGVTGVGVPVRMTDALTLENLDPSATFSIREIHLDYVNQAFEIIDAPKNQVLAPSSTTSFSVIFDPHAAGRVDFVATLYLDQDPVAQSEVHLVGDAVDVAVFGYAQGGGGCNIGGNGLEGGFVLALAALGIIGRGRRRTACPVVVS